MELEWKWDGKFSTENLTVQQNSYRIEMEWKNNGK